MNNDLSYDGIEELDDFDIEDFDDIEEIDADTIKEINKPEQSVDANLSMYDDIDLIDDSDIQVGLPDSAIADLILDTIQFTNFIINNQINFANNFSTKARIKATKVDNTVRMLSETLNESESAISQIYKTSKDSISSFKNNAGENATVLNFMKLNCMAVTQIKYETITGQKLTDSVKKELAYLFNSVKDKDLLLRGEVPSVRVNNKVIKLNGDFSKFIKIYATIAYTVYNEDITELDLDLLPETQEVIEYKNNLQHRREMYNNFVMYSTGIYKSVAIYDSLQQQIAQIMQTNKIIGSSTELQNSFVVLFRNNSTLLSDYLKANSISKENFIKSLEVADVLTSFFGNADNTIVTSIEDMLRGILFESNKSIDLTAVNCIVMYTIAEKFITVLDNHLRELVLKTYALGLNVTHKNNSFKCTCSFCRKIIDIPKVIEFGLVQGKDSRMSYDTFTTELSKMSVTNNFGKIAKELLNNELVVDNYDLQLTNSDSKPLYCSSGLTNMRIINLFNSSDDDNGIKSLLKRIYSCALTINDVYCDCGKTIIISPILLRYLLSFHISHGQDVFIETETYSVKSKVTYSEKLLNNMLKDYYLNPVISNYSDITEFNDTSLSTDIVISDSAIEKAYKGIKSRLAIYTDILKKYGITRQDSTSAINSVKYTISDILCKFETIANSFGIGSSQFTNVILTFVFDESNTVLRNTILEYAYWKELGAIEKLLKGYYRFDTNKSEIVRKDTDTFIDTSITYYERLVYRATELLSYANVANYDAKTICEDYSAYKKLMDTLSSLSSDRSYQSRFAHLVYTSRPVSNSFSIKSINTLSEFESDAKTICSCIDMSSKWKTWYVITVLSYVANNNSGLLETLDDKIPLSMRADTVARKIQDAVIYTANNRTYPDVDINNNSIRRVSRTSLSNDLRYLNTVIEPFDSTDTLESLMLNTDAKVKPVFVNLPLPGLITNKLLSIVLSNMDNQNDCMRLLDNYIATDFEKDLALEKSDDIPDIKEIRLDNNTEDIYSSVCTFINTALED